MNRGYREAASIHGIDVTVPPGNDEVPGTRLLGHIICLNYKQQLTLLVDAVFINLLDTD